MPVRSNYPTFPCAPYVRRQDLYLAWVANPSAANTAKLLSSFDDYIAKWADLYHHLYGVDKDELTDDGVSALGEALVTFNPAHINAPFSQWSAQFVQRAMENRAIDSVMAGLPFGTVVRELFVALPKAMQRLELTPPLNHDQLVQLAEDMGAKLRHLRLVYYRLFPDDAPCCDPALGDCPSNTPSAEDVLVAKDISDALEAAIQTLPPREALVIQARFYDDLTLQATAPLINDVCQERVHQIESMALRRLKHPSRSRRVRDATPLDLRVRSDAWLDAVID